MTVESWDPANVPSLGADRVQQYVAAAARLDVPDFGLDSAQVDQLGRFARHEGPLDWGAAAAGLPDAQIEALIRLFTLAEMRFPAWEAGAKSPVVPLVALLKGRGNYPGELTRWIKANTSNRFLPYGSLLDRL